MVVTVDVVTAVAIWWYVRLEGSRHRRACSALYNHLFL